GAFHPAARCVAFGLAAADRPPADFPGRPGPHSPPPARPGIVSPPGCLGALSGRRVGRRLRSAGEFHDRGQVSGSNHRCVLRDRLVRHPPTALLRVRSRRPAVAGPRGEARGGYQGPAGERRLGIGGRRRRRRVVECVGAGGERLGFHDPPVAQRRRCPSGNAPARRPTRLVAQDPALRNGIDSGGRRIRRRHGFRRPHWLGRDSQAYLSGKGSAPEPGPGRLRWSRMNTGVGHRIRFLPAACDLLACLAAFYAVSQVFAAEPTDWLVAIPASALTSWLAAISLRDRESGLSLWIDQLFYAAGLTMLSQYGLAYVFGFWPAPLWVIAAGVVLSVVLMALLRKWVRPELAGARSGVLFLGFD